MEKLIGGREEITRIGDRVHRPAGRWSNQVQLFLHHIHQNGFDKAPKPFGFDDQGREVVSYLQGEVINYPLTSSIASLEALTSSAGLLREYHDASVGFFANPNHRPELWQLPSRLPCEVICHGDFAPYNVVFKGAAAVGIIDFDTAHPAPRSWDIAYALYRWAPFTHPSNKDGFGSISDQIERAKKFCDAYGFPNEHRVSLSSLIIERLNALVNFILEGAKMDDPTSNKSIRNGHKLLYLRDIEYLDKNSKKIDESLQS